VIKPSDVIDVSAGLIRFGSRVIDDMHRYGQLTFEDVIVKSSNVGAIKVGLKLGAERMGLYIRRFGFGRPSSPDFPGESPGIVWEASKLNDSALASVSMGYQVGVTPLQMAAAASVIANGGTLYEPHVVRAIVKGNQRTVVRPKAVRRAILPETAATLTTIMEQVVIDGTAKAARLVSYNVAGKTGTADKLVNGRYSPYQQNVSFVGFVPSRNPVLTVLVMVDSPRVGGDTGGAIAAPIFKRIADASLRRLGVTPTIDPAPPVIVARQTNESVAPAAAPLNAPAVVSLPANAEAGVPDLTGMSAREALRELARVGLTARMQGAGFVVDQHPSAGSPLEPGATCTLVLDRRPGVPVARTPRDGAGSSPARPNGAIGDQR
jgi:cell division protein FtsI (penicillin-binding protein 3)